MTIYAHRGSSGQFAEHTRAAYLQALADGADGVECDLHLTADGALVLWHDETVDRTSDGTGTVAEHTLAQMRDLDVSSWKGAPIPEAYGGRAEQMLTLDELLDILCAAGRPVGLALELKYDGPFTAALADSTLAALLARGWSPESSLLGNVGVSFMSFHPEAVRHLARTVPASFLCQLLDVVEVAEVRDELDLGRLAASAAAFVMRRAMAEGADILDDGVAQLAGPGVDYLRAHPDRAKQWLRAGRRFRVWTVDSADDFHYCRDFGVSEVTTNEPARMKELDSTVVI